MSVLGARMSVAGDFFGEISLIENKPRGASVVALTPMTLMRLDLSRIGSV